MTRAETKIIKEANIQPEMDTIIMDRFNEEKTPISDLSPKDNYLNGVFYFSNNSDLEFSAYWNSVKYTFPPKTASPMIITGESLEGVQEIRKRFATKWAQDMMPITPEYKKLVEVSAKNLYPAIAPVKDILEPLIQMCISPLPIEMATTKQETPIERMVEGRTRPTIKASRPVQKGEKATKIIDSEDPTKEEVGKL